MDIYQGTENKTIKNIAIGIGIAFITTFILLLIFSAILTYSNISENMINPTIIVITAISILIGSSIVNMKIKKNGLINGGIIGGLYILTIYLISSLLNWKFALNTQSIIMIIVGIVFGILGGIIGVNQKLYFLFLGWFINFLFYIFNTRPQKGK